MEIQGRGSIDVRIRELIFGEWGREYVFCWGRSGLERREFAKFVMGGSLGLDGILARPGRFFLGGHEDVKGYC